MVSRDLIAEGDVDFIRIPFVLGLHDGRAWGNRDLDSQGPRKVRRRFPRASAMTLYGLRR